MNESSKRRSWFGTLLLIAGTAITVKALWVAAEIFFLPVTGVEKKQRSTIKMLPRNYRLASNEALPKPVKKPIKKIQGSIRDLHLLATYQDPVRDLAVINKGAKNIVAHAGDDVFGYRLTRVGDRWAILSRGGNEYRIEIKDDNKAIDKAVLKSSPSSFTQKPPPEGSRIHREGETTFVPKELIIEYTKNIDKIRQEIGVSPQKSGNQLTGFRIRYIKRHSVFEKLGLKIGDVITAINGEPIVDYGTAMELLQSAKTLEGLSLEIKRGNQKVDLEYEVE